MDVYSMSIAGGTEIRITSDGIPKGRPVWSPDGTRLMFLQQTDSGFFLRIADARTGRSEPVGATPGLRAETPQWTPDGERVLYVDGRRRNIMLLDLRTGNERRAISGEPLGWVYLPVMSPSAARVLVSWHRPPNSGTSVLEIDNGTESAVPPIEGVPLLWTRTDSIYYAAGEGDRIYAVPRRGGRPRLHARFPEPCDIFDAISIAPDTRTIVCAVRTRESDVWVLDHFDQDP
jgi:hypothetical protein